MDNTVNNLRAVIIGASSGIGREVATLLSAAGYSPSLSPPQSSPVAST